MSLVPRILALAALLAADLLFFIFLGRYYPEVFDLVLQWIPWQSPLKKPIIILLGLIIAVATSVAIIHTIIIGIKKMIKE